MCLRLTGWHTRIMDLNNVYRELWPWIRSRSEDETGIVVFLDAAVGPALLALAEHDDLLLEPVNRYGAYLRSASPSSPRPNGFSLELSVEAPRGDLSIATANAWVLLSRIAGAGVDAMHQPLFETLELQLLIAQLLYTGEFGSPVEPLGPVARTMATLISDRLGGEPVEAVDSEFALTIPELHQTYLTALRLSR